MAYQIVVSNCTVCGACEFECPNAAIAFQSDTYVIDPELCTECKGHYDLAQCGEVCPVAIVSNKGPDAIRHSLRQLGMDGLVQHIFGDDGHLPKKPDPALYTGAIQAAFPDARAESTLMVGDTASDLRFAKNAGLRACWAAYGYGGAEECGSVGYEFRVDGLAELLPIVQGLPA